jgi:hypothetical protein
LLFEVMGYNTWKERLEDSDKASKWQDDSKRLGLEMLQQSRPQLRLLLLEELDHFEWMGSWGNLQVLLKTQEIKLVGEGIDQPLIELHTWRKEWSLHWKSSCQNQVHVINRALEDFYISLLLPKGHVLVMSLSCCQSCRLLWIHLDEGFSRRLSLKSDKTG